MTSSCTIRDSNERPISSESRWMHGSIYQTHQQHTAASSSMHHVVPKGASTQTMKNPMDSGQSQISAVSQSSNLSYWLSHTKISRSEAHSSTRLVLSHPKRTSESSQRSSRVIQMPLSQISTSDSQIDHGGHLESVDSTDKSTIQIYPKPFEFCQVMRQRDFIWR